MTGLRVVPNDLAGAGLLCLMVALNLGIAELWARTRSPNPEFTRKYVHITGGLGSLLFPFLVASHWVVLFLALGFAGLFLAGSRFGWFRSLGSVQRRSRGSEYYPLAIWGLFFISQGRLWLYVTSVLILTMADALAALVGSEYGRIRYRVGAEGEKSVEGSVFFLMISFNVVQITLSLMTPYEPAKCILIGFYLAVLLTGMEAVSTRGTDNIYIPLLTCYTLLRITTKPLSEIIFQCVSLVGIILLLVAVIRFSRTFSVRDAILFILFTYGNWALGSHHWVVPIFIAFGLYATLAVVIPNRSGYEIQSRLLIYALLVPFAILVYANAVREEARWFGPYLVSLMTAFCFGVWFYLGRNRPLAGPTRGLALAVICLGAVPVTLVATGLFQAALPLPAILVITLLAFGVLLIYERLIIAPDPDQGMARAAHFMWIGETVAAALFLGLQAALDLPVWHPGG